MTEPWMRWNAVGFFAPQSKTIQDLSKNRYMLSYDYCLNQDYNVEIRSLMFTRTRVGARTDPWVTLALTLLADLYWHNDVVRERIAASLPGIPLLCMFFKYLPFNKCIVFVHILQYSYITHLFPSFNKISYLNTFVSTIFHSVDTYNLCPLTHTRSFFLCICSAKKTHKILALSQLKKKTNALIVIRKISAEVLTLVQFQLVNSNLILKFSQWYQVHKIS